jgi:hypothetical protein
MNVQKWSPFGAARGSLFMVTEDDKEDLSEAARADGVTKERHES